MSAIIRALAGSGEPCHASIWPGSGEWDSSDLEHTLMRSDGQPYWHSLVLRMGSAGSFVARTEGRFGERRDRPRRPEGKDPEARTAVAVLFLSSPYSFYSSHLFIKFSALREGACWGMCGGNTPPAPLLVNLGQSNEDALPAKGGLRWSRDPNGGCLQS